jgi:rod shape determining protein RodA
MPRDDKKFTGKVDWVTVLLYLLLVGIGLLAIYSTEFREDRGDILSFTKDSMKYNTVKQMIFAGVCIIVGFVLLIIDSKFYTTFSYITYGIIIVLLLSVFVLGEDIYGNKAWIKIGSFYLQPGEFAKFASALALAKYLSGLNVDIRKVKDLMFCAAIIGLPMLIVLAQGDAGTAIVYTVFLFVLFREGLSGIFLILEAYVILLFILTLNVNKFILAGAMVAIAAIVVYYNMKRKGAVYLALGTAVVSLMFIFSVDYLFFHVAKPHQQDRILIAWKFDKKEIMKRMDKDKTLNIRHSMIAIGSGRLVGKGYLNGIMTKGDHVPEQSTDFVFSTIGEEFGFVGSFVLVALFVLLFMRLIYLAERQRSKFARVYGYSVAGILFFHFLINIGMVIGVIPVIGIPLPFISYGGSSLLSFTILLFIFIRFDTQRYEVLR